MADELAFIFVLLVPIVKAGYSVNLEGIIAAQTEGAFIGSASGIIAFIIGILCIQAKMTLPPFHIPEAETEIIEGPFMAGDRVVVVEDVITTGGSALKAVEREPPDLILLDLNLPKKSGPEVLAEIKADPWLRRIPVVILTVSKAEEDVLKSYNLHANCYITKPVNLDQFLEVVKSIEDFWLTVVMLPPR